MISDLSTKKKILYKVEGSEKLGMGHVFRSFFLIQKLIQKYQVIIFTEKNSKSEEFFKKKNFELVTYKKKNQFKIFKQYITNNIIFKFINDAIHLDQKYIFLLKKIKCKCFFLDTIKVKASNNFYCINTFLKTKQTHKNYFYGLKYVITDPSLKIKKNNSIKKEIKLLLHFGGTDDRLLNLKIINIFF